MSMAAELVMRVLILAREILGAGLLGALVDAAGFEPAFPIAGEHGAAAIARLHPALALVEATHPAARSDAFFSAAAAAGCRVLLFSPSPPWDDLAAIARRHGAALIYPETGESLADVIARALTRP